MTSPRRVLHVLPHPGGGGETYVDLLSEMEAYRTERIYLAPDARPRPALVRGVVQAFRACRRCDLVHVEGEVAAGLCRPLLAARPSVVTLNGLHLLRRLEGAARQAARLNLRSVLRAADRTICVSASERETLVRAVGERAAAHAVVIPNGVAVGPLPPDGERSDVRAEFGLGDAETVAIWVGGLDEHKDPLTAARAAAAASLPLLVVGDGPLRSRLETVPGARLLGRRDDVPRLLRASDIFVLTSRREGLSFALLEAMAAGLAPVVSALAENVEAIGASGMAVSPGDEGAFAAALRRLADDRAERTRLGAEARRRVAEAFRADEMVARTREIYDDVLAGSVGRPS